MKLYTEEHLKLFYQLGKFDGIATRENDVEEEIKNHIPIELPTDEEIEDASLEENNDDLSPAEEFKRGAIWMRDKIQGGEQ